MLIVLFFVLNSLITRPTDKNKIVIANGTESRSRGVRDKAGPHHNGLRPGQGQMPDAEIVQDSISFSLSMTFIFL